VEIKTTADTQVAIPAESTEKPAASAVEAPAATPKAPEPKGSEFASKFAALSRKERDIQKRDAELKLREEGLKGKSIDDLRAKAKTSKREVLRDLGINYSELTDEILTDGQDTPEKKLTRVEQKLKELEDKDAQQKVAEQKAAETAAENAYKSKISEYVTSNPEACELIKGSETETLVFQVVEEYHSKTGRILSVEEACAEVEKYLESTLTKLSKLKKFQKYLPAQEASASGKSTPTEKQVTLTNRDSTAGAAARISAKSEEEAFAEAMKLLKFK
jgi:hypothetical protein